MILPNLLKKVAEMTGRSKRIVRNKYGTPNFKWMTVPRNSKAENLEERYS